MNIKNFSTEELKIELKNRENIVFEDSEPPKKKSLYDHRYKEGFNVCDCGGYRVTSNKVKVNGKVKEVCFPCLRRLEVYRDRLEEFEVIGEVNREYWETDLVKKDVELNGWSGI